MSNNPLVSVIIPNYNHARFLEERIQSVLNQTCQDFELIILDDCSPDNGASKAIIEQYRDNPHVSHIVYNEVNSGSTFKQWRKGMELARGKYIWIAESDDSCDTALLESLITPLEEYHAVMAFCRSVKYDGNGKRHFHWQDILHSSGMHDGFCFIKQFLWKGNHVANASSVVFRRDAAIDIDLCYTQMRAAGDWLFWILLAECGRVYFLDKELNYFRCHGTNVTQKNECNGITAHERLQIYNYLVKKGHLSGLRKHSHRINMIHLCKSLPFDEQTKQEVMQLWDPYGVYRLLYPFVRLKAFVFHFCCR